MALYLRGTLFRLWLYTLPTCRNLSAAVPFINDVFPWHTDIGHLWNPRKGLYPLHCTHCLYTKYSVWTGHWHRLCFCSWLLENVHTCKLCILLTLLSIVLSKIATSIAACVHSCGHILFLTPVGCDMWCWSARYRYIWLYYI